MFRQRLATVTPSFADDGNDKGMRKLGWELVPKIVSYERIQWGNTGPRVEISGAQNVVVEPDMKEDQTFQRVFDEAVRCPLMDHR